MSHFVNAAMMGDLDSIQKYIKSAKSSGNLAVLLDAKAGPPLCGTPLVRAAGHGHTRICEVLIAAGADTEATTSYGETALILAHKFGHTDTCLALIAAGVDVNVKASDGCSILIRAAGSEDKRVCKALIKAGANVDVKTEHGYSALMLAARNGDIDVCKMLLAAGANVDAATAQGYTPLMGAGGNGHATICKLLIDAGADINAATGLGFTALMCAVKDGHAGVAAVLIEAGVDVDAASSHGYTALMTAAMHNNDHICKMLLTARADPDICDKKGGTAAERTTDWRIRELLDSWPRKPRDVAISYARPKRAPVLSDKSADVSKEAPDAEEVEEWQLSNKGCVARAADSGVVHMQGSAAHGCGSVPPCAIESPTAVISNAVNVATGQRSSVVGGADSKDTHAAPVGSHNGEATGSAPPLSPRARLFVAATSGDKALACQALIDKADVDSVAPHDGLTPLMVASSKGHHTLVKLFGAAGASVETFDAFGRTALLHAASNGQVACVKQLIGFGACLQHADKAGMNALMHASAGGCPDAILFCVDAGISIKSRSDAGKTALHYAAAGRVLEDTNCSEIVAAVFALAFDGAVKTLVSLGADVNARDPEGNTPLLAASLAGHAPAVYALLGSGGDMTLRNAAGMTPLSAALKGDHAAARDILMKAAMMEEDELPAVFAPPGRPTTRNPPEVLP